MSLHLPAILSPPTPCIPVLALTVLSARVVAGVASSLHGSASGFGLRLSLAGSPMHQAVSCSSWFCLWTGSSSPVALHPPFRATQFPSTTDSQCSVRWGLPPHCWCALSGALGTGSRRSVSICEADRSNLIRTIRLGHWRTGRGPSLPKNGRAYPYRSSRTVRKPMRSSLVSGERWRILRVSSPLLDLKFPPRTTGLP